MYQTIKRLYAKTNDISVVKNAVKTNDISVVKNAVKKGWITEEEYEAITGQAYA